MSYRNLLSGLALAVLLPVVATAQMSSAGDYTTITTWADTTMMADGSMEVMSHFSQLVMADDDGFPMNNMRSQCVGKMMVSAGAMMPHSGSGSCYSQNMAGDGISMWWRVTEGGTDECPFLCGAYGYYDGTGAMKGVAGGGRWMQKAVWDDGSIGSWEGTAELPM